MRISILAGTCPKAGYVGVDRPDRIAEIACRRGGPYVFWMSMTASARRSWSVRRLLSDTNWACSTTTGSIGAHLGPRLTAFKAS